MGRPMKKQLVQIEWVDSGAGVREWEYIEGLQPLKPERCVSVGFLLEGTAEYKTICQSMSKTQVFGRMTIPSCSIKKVIRLRGG